MKTSLLFLALITVTASAQPADGYLWQNFTVKDGLPAAKAHSIRIDGERVWIGTHQGVALYENGRFQTIGVKDGLGHPVVLGIDVDPALGDVWFATMAGLSRYSAGRMETFTQFNSGLANDVVYAVAVDGPHVWSATAAGVSRFDTRTKQWSIFDESNTPMHEPWCYAIAPGPDYVYVGVWAGGVLEYNKATGQWKDYVDPDGEFELDLFPDDGPVHDVTSGIAYAGGKVWAATYFGLATYDGARWKGYFDHDSGLASNFINYAYATERAGWLCTDKGLSAFDGTTWRTYLRREDGRGEVIVTGADGRVERRQTPTGFAHNYILGIDIQGDIVWVATHGGVSRGVPIRSGLLGQNASK